MFRSARIPAVLGAVLLGAALAVPHFVLAGEGYGYDETSKKHDIVETAATDASFDTLVKAVKAAGLTETLEGDGPYTLFAPTDAAFDALPEGKLESLMKPENKDRLASILSYHVVPAEITASQAMKMDQGSTVHGDALMLSTRDRSLRVNDATVVESGIEASNGVIHAIDRVLMPKSGGSTGR
jgi:uncharacterized surface protein with fasciclin (FAS1) repeats